MISQSGSTGDAGDQYTGLDRFGRVIDQRWITGTGSSASDVDRYGYTYDRNSNRTARANALNAAYSESYTYDDLNQLQIFTRSGGTPTTQGWMVDALGNWTFRVTDSLPEFGTANAQNELTDIDSATLAYDANGNMTVDELGRSLTYDAWNRLTVVVDAYSIPVAAYQYDALGQRVLCYTDDGTVAELRDLFYSDLWQVLEERVRPVTGGVSSQADVQNVWSPVYVDALIERDRDADASATTGVGGLEERVYALQDANWNTTALVAASVSGVAAGTVLNRFIYSAYGEAEVFDAAWSAVSATSVPWTQLFQGLSMTGLTGLAYVRHRDYSPRLGRFIQRDPLGFEAGDNNLYRFVQNEPSNKVDPTGFEGYVYHGAYNPDGPLGDASPQTWFTQHFDAAMFAASSAWIVPGGRDRCNRLTEKMRDNIVTLGKEYYDNDFYKIEYVDFNIPPTLYWIEHGALKLTMKLTDQVLYLDNGVIRNKYNLVTMDLSSLKDLSTPGDLPAGWSEKKVYPLEPARGKPGYWW